MTEESVQSRFFKQWLNVRGKLRAIAMIREQGVSTMANLKNYNTE
ncbi:MAG: hypothetical protein SAL70_29600 [Scytonema sp. PMC 1070.18]|nr:hypothetical protein [Scytonema sp. PMC 1070.18]